MAAREAAIGKGGLLKGSELAQVFASLRANDLIWPYVVKGYLKGQARPRSTCCTGTATTRTCPARCSAGTCATPTWRTSCASPAPPCSAASRSTSAASTCPSFLYASKEDHIVPWKSAYASTQLLSGTDVRARRQRPHRRCDQPAGEEQAQLLDQHGRRSVDADPEGWFDAAESVPGSWWRYARREARPARQRQYHDRRPRY